MLVAAAAATALLTLVGTALAENYQYRFTKADEALAARIVHRPTTKGRTGGAAKPDCLLTRRFVRATTHRAGLTSL